MIEYIQNAIRATAGDDTPVCAIITDADGNAITSGCYFTLFDKDNSILSNVDGIFNGTEWEFKIPKEVTAGLEGRYYYYIRTNDEILNFREFIYFV